MLSPFGCNAILGIDEAEPITSDAALGASGNSGSGGSAGAGGGDVCSLQATDACNGCVAQNCCSEYEACVADSTCKAALVDYAFCLGRALTADAGVTCDETFSTTNAASVALGNCTFVEQCSADCSRKTIGDLCFNYCGCMNDACPEKQFTDSCEVACSAFSDEQLVCRPYHCSLARLNRDRDSEPDRALHCGHAFGESLCP